MSDDIKKEASAEAPKYELTEAAYIDDVLLSPGATITYKGIPGHHMEPLNDAARAMKKKHNKAFIDPIEAMTIIG